MLLGRRRATSASFDVRVLVPDAMTEELAFRRCLFEFFDERVGNTKKIVHPTVLEFDRKLLALGIVPEPGNNRG